MTGQQTARQAFDRIRLDLETGVNDATTINMLNELEGLTVCALDTLDAVKAAVDAADNRHGFSRKVPDVFACNPDETVGAA